MRRKYILIAALTLAAFGSLVYFYAGSRVPSGQLPLEKLAPQNVAVIQDEFNAARGDARLLLLLSPT